MLCVHTHNMYVYVLRYSSQRMSKNEKDCWVFGRAIELARTRASSVCVLSPYRIFKFSFAFWMAVRMYCAPPTKIDSILRCLETLCDFASVSTYTHYALAHTTRLSSSATRCPIHAFAHSLTLALSMSQNAWYSGRKTDAAATYRSFSEGGEQNLSLLVCPSHENHTYSHYTTSMYLELLNGEWANESYLANLYAHGPRHLYTRACTHRTNWTIHYILFQSSSQVSLI